MEMSQEDKKVLSLYLSSFLFSKLENELYKLLLPEEYRKPENILETIFLGITHLTNRMHETVGSDSLWGGIFCEQLKWYAEGYLDKNKLSTPLNFHYLLTDKMEENQFTLKTFVFQNPGPILPSLELNRFLINPLKEPLPDASFNPEPLISFLPVVRQYISVIDKFFLPLQEDIRIAFTERV